MQIRDFGLFWYTIDVRVSFYLNIRQLNIDLRFFVHEKTELLSFKIIIIIEKIDYYQD